MKKLAFFVLAASAWGQTTINGDRTILGQLDLSNATALIPPGVPSDPSGACTSPAPGKASIVLSLASGNLFGCVSGAWRLSSGTPGVNGQSPVMRGQWSAAQNYVPLDVVAYQGSSWWAIAPSANSAPGTNSTKWTQLAAAGAGGPAGATGPVGAQGPIGATGPGGASGPIGPGGAAGSQGIAGPVGPAGPQGTAGSAGATGPTGPAGATGAALRSRGVWTSSVSYSALDSVSYNGSSYVAVVNNSNVTPGSDTTKWNLVGAISTLGIQSAGAQSLRRATSIFRGRSWRPAMPARAGST